MSGDYSRWSFDPWRDFSAVLMQQGRVQSDADWNEWVTAILRRIQAGTLDTVGPAVVPRETPEGFRIQAAGGALTIGRGRIYVDGLLAENHGAAPLEWDPQLAELRGTTPLPYGTQPYFPDPPALPASGPHLVYLKAWEREVTYIEDPRIVEKALGVDTTARKQTVWQVKVLANPGAGVTCATPLEDIPRFVAAESRSAGRLSTDTADIPSDPDPCHVPPSGGYKGLENQLYRVEIHTGGTMTGAGRATFKWSRDNATVASRVTAIPALDRIVVESVGRDAMLRFADGDWIEVTDDWRELNGLPGEMRRIRAGGGVDDATRTILLESPLPAAMFPVDALGNTTPGRNTRVRRWDQRGRVRDSDGNLIIDLDATTATGTIPVQPPGTSIVLEHGIIVTFDLDPASGSFLSGDHWLFAARTPDASVETLDRAPPRGIHAHYAKLALVTFPDSETDCRTLWPPETAEEGCDCSVCVSAESHNSGTLTIQTAIDRVKATGGTVCLGPGTYTLLETVRIDDGRSVRVRGQGWKTLLVAAGGGEALRIEGTIGVAIENLTIATGVRAATNAITMRNCFLTTVEDCIVANLPVGAGTGAAIGLESLLIDVAVERCLLSGFTGIGGGSAAESYVATAGLRLVDNWLLCSTNGVALERFGLHVGETRIANNTAQGCSGAGVLALGGTLPGGTFDIKGNVVTVEGAGVIVGTDAARVCDNEVLGFGPGRSGDGITLAPGLDPGGIDHCQVLGNRLSRIARHGIAIRTRVNSAMIRNNVVANAGGAGILMERDGAAVRLAVENNQLQEIATAANVSGQHAAAMRFVDVRDLDVSGNSIDGFARTAVQNEACSAIQLVAARAARIDANRLSGIGPPNRFVGDGAGIEVVPPFASTQIASNRVRRRGRTDGRLEPGAWSAVRVRGEFERGGAPSGPVFFPLGNVAVVIVPAAGTFVVTETRLFAEPRSGFGEVAVRGNDLEVELSTAEPFLVGAAASCIVSDNRCALLPLETPDERLSTPSLIRSVRAVASANDLRGPPKYVLRVNPIGTRGSAAILGNVCSGEILLNDHPLPPPWDALNPVSPE